MKKLLTFALLGTLVGANAEAITFKNPRDAKLIFILQPSGTRDQITVPFRNNESSITRTLTEQDIPHRYMNGQLHIAVLVHNGGHEKVCPQTIDLNLGFQAINDKTVTYDPDDPKGFCTISK